MARFSGTPAASPRFNGKPVDGGQALPPDNPIAQIQQGLNDANPTYAGKPMGAMDMLSEGYNAIGSGLTRGVVGTATLPGTLADVGHNISQKVGINPAVERALNFLNPAAMIGEVGRTLGGPDAANPIGYQNVAGAMERMAPGSIDFQPKTRAGRYLQTGASFVGGGGGVKAAIAPALAYQTADEFLPEGKLKEAAKIGAALFAPFAVKGAGRMLTPSVATPRVTVADLKAEGTKAFDAADAAGVVVNRNGMKSLASNVVKDLTEHGFDPANEPGAMGALKRIQAGAGGNVTLKGLHTIRKVASNGYIPGNGSNNKVISLIINRIDELIGSKDPSLMSGLNTQAGVDAFQKALKTWHQARKLETVEKFATKGEAIGNSQINQDVEGATRRQVRTLLTNEGKARGFTPAEMDAAKRAASMTTGMRTLRALSGMVPGGKLTGAVHGTMAMSHLASGNLPALLAQGVGFGVGAAAKAGESALSKRAFDKFAGVVANGGAPVASGRPQLRLTSQELARLLLATHGAAQ